MLLYNGTLATASPHDPLLATLRGNTLCIYETPLVQPQQPQYIHPVREIPLAPAFAAELNTIAFSPPSPPSVQNPTGPRILLASTTTVHVQSALPDEAEPFHASILNAASPSKALHSAKFLSADEVILVPELAPRLTIRHLTTGLGLEIRDAKHSGIVGPPATRNVSEATIGYSIRNESNHTAFLTRPAVGKDVVVILGPQQVAPGELSRPAREVEIDFPIATSDAFGLSFSPDGAWLAVWDSASTKTGSDLVAASVYIYTATGTLYKHWTDADASDSANLGLGVETIAWLADSRLAIATVDGRVVILAASTFEEEAAFKHPAVFDVVSVDFSIYVEQIAAWSGERAYVAATLPAAPPARTARSIDGTPALSKGVTHMAVSADGLFLASVSAHTPTTVQVTSLEHRRVKTRAVLIHHAPVLSIDWHPTISGWLLIRTIQERSSTMAFVYTWSAQIPEPMVVKASLPTLGMSKAFSQDHKSTPSTPAATHVEWLIPPSSSLPDTIPDLLFSFPTVTASLSAIPTNQSLESVTELEAPFQNGSSHSHAPTAAHKLTEKTPIKGTGWEPAFDESFENLRAESLAQSEVPSTTGTTTTTDAAFSPVKFDVTDWTRRQFLDQPGEDQDDDTFVGKRK